MYTPFKMKGKSPMMKKLIGKQGNLPEHLKAKIEAAPESPTKMMKKSPTKMAKKSPAKVVGLKEKLAAQREKRAKGMKSGKVSLSGLNEKIQKGAANVSRVLKGKNKDGTSKGGLVIKSEKDETTGKRSTTITRANNTDKKTGGNGGGGNGGNGGGGNSSGFSGMKGGDAKYTYKKNNDGSYTGKNSKTGKTFTIKEGEGGYDKLESSGLKMKKSAMKMKKAPTKMKKESSMKMMKKSPNKMMKKSKKS